MTDFWATRLLPLLIQGGQLLLGLSLLVLIHELGHFFFARLFKMRVDKFYLFFDAGGKALLRYKPKGSQTEYGIGWLPLGGYCKIAGMIDESYVSEGKPSEASASEFRNKPAWQRLLVMFGGVLFNFILALAVYTGLSLKWGSDSLPSSQMSYGWVFSTPAIEAGFQDGDVLLQIDGKEQDALADDFLRSVINARSVLIRRAGDTLSVPIPPKFMEQIIASKEGLMSPLLPFVVNEVLPQTPAAQAGFLPGDRVLAVNNAPTPEYADVQRHISLNPGKTLTVQLLRRSDTLALTVTPTPQGTIGVSLKDLRALYPIQTIKYNLWEAIPQGWHRGVAAFGGYAGDFKYVFTKEGASEMGGFLSIGKLFPETFSWYYFWQICAYLSVIFAFMNLLPIPALDGGHIIFLLWEVITRRRVSDKVLIKAQMVGLVLLLLLMLYANGNDIIRLF